MAMEVIKMGFVSFKEKFLRAISLVIGSFLVLLPVDLLTAAVGRQGNVYLAIPLVIVSLILKSVVATLLLNNFLKMSRGEKSPPIFGFSITRVLGLVVLFAAIIGFAYLLAWGLEAVFGLEARFFNLIFGAALLWLIYAGFFGCLAIVDRGESPLAAFWKSLKLTHIEKPYIFLFVLMGLLLAFLGGLFFGVGYFVVMPFLLFVYCKAYDEWYDRAPA